MKTMIDNIHNIIDKLSKTVEDTYYSMKYRVFFKGWRSYVDDIVFEVKGRLATLVFTIGRITGELEGRYIVKRTKEKD